MSTMPAGGTLALDLNGVGRHESKGGPAIGWAYGLLEWKNPLSGYWPFPQRLLAARYVAFVDLLNDVVMDEWRPGNIYYERPLPPNIPNTNAMTMEQIYGVLAFVREACERSAMNGRPVKISGDHVNTIRTNVIGRHQWPDGKTKPHVIRFVRDVLKLDVFNDNEADAIICWHDYRQKMLQIPPARHTLFRYGMAE